MIKFTEADIDKMMQLARFKSSPERKERLLSDLNSIMSRMEIIDEINTSELAAYNRPIHKYPGKS